jgi:hypothetical protein
MSTSIILIYIICALGGINVGIALGMWLQREFGGQTKT